MTVLVVVPHVTATLAPASAVPLTATPAVFSTALTMSLVANVAMTGKSGAILSTEKTLSTLKALWVPPAFSTTAVILCWPCDKATDGVKVQVLPLTVALPSKLLPSNTLTTSPVAMAPVTVPEITGLSVLTAVAIAVTAAVAVGTVASTLKA